MANTSLDLVKGQQWFYEFVLPDGSITDSYLPNFVRTIHLTREKALLFFLNEYSKKGTFKNALDISCHEGYYSLLLAKHFEDVIGIDKNENSLDKAKLITEVLSAKNIQYVHTALEDWKETAAADFTLCFGLLYHIENPVAIMRKLASITKKAICIESQILPSETTMNVEDGCYLKQRDVQGSFGLCLDYPTISEGGLTELALVPSKQALVTLLDLFGFVNIRFYSPNPEDYEQFVRGHRVIVYAEKKDFASSN